MNLKKKKREQKGWKNLKCIRQAAEKFQNKAKGADSSAVEEKCLLGVRRHMYVAETQRKTLCFAE